MCESLSCVWLFVTPWTVAHQAPLSLKFSRQGCWSGLPFPFPGDLPDPGLELESPALQVNSLPSEPSGLGAFSLGFPQPFLPVEIILNLLSLKPFLYPGRHCSKSSRRRSSACTTLRVVSSSEPYFSNTHQFLEGVLLVLWNLNVKFGILELLSMWKYSITEKCVISFSPGDQQGTGNQGLFNPLTFSILSSISCKL